MNILFINPPFLKNFSRSQRSPAVTKSGTIYYPYWLCYAAGVADKNGHNSLIIDAAPHNLTIKNIEDKIRTFKPDIAVIDTSTPSIYNDVHFAEMLKSWVPNIINIMVGTHPSALPEETLKLSSSIDIIARGEYDYTITDIANNPSIENLKNIKGISYQTGGKIYHNPSREFIKNLDELPFVSKVYKKHLNIKDYYFAAADYPMIMTITGRGCPFHCFYCVYPQTLHGRKYRYRSPENVVAEFEYIKKNFPNVKEIVIEDDTFTTNPARVREISELLIEKRLNIKWSCNSRAQLDYETMRLMKKAGCRLLIVGYESGVQEILDNMHKNLKLSESIKFTKDAHRAGLLIHGCFMLGNPGETPETIKTTYKFAKKLKCDSTQFYPLFVYPGTEAYEWAMKNKYITTLDYSKWLTDTGRHNSVINLNNMTGDTITEISEKLTFKYHIRLHYFLQKLLQLFKAPSEFKRSMHSGFIYFSRLLKNIKYIVKNG